MARQTPISRYRNIGISAHIDAGKTTTTERILFYTGVSHKLGEVHDGAATMDWMEQEQERGITITSAATTCFWRGMEMQWPPYRFNIIDTPGHVTSRSKWNALCVCSTVLAWCTALWAACSPSLKRFGVRPNKYHVPALAFVNKMDRDGKDPFDLLDEIEEELHIHVRPLSWPIDMGQRFRGVYNIYEQKLNLYTPSKQYVTENIEFKDINSPELGKLYRAGTGGKAAFRYRTDRRCLSRI